MASIDFVYPYCGEAPVRDIATSPPPRGVLRHGDFPVVIGPPEGSMTFCERFPQVPEVIRPKDRFVTLEPSDDVWAIPLGISRVVKRDCREGDVLDVVYGNETMKVAVTGRAIRQSDRAMMIHEVRFDVVAFVSTDAEKPSK